MYLTDPAKNKRYWNGALGAPFELWWSVKQGQYFGALLQKGTDSAYRFHTKILFLIFYCSKGHCLVFISVCTGEKEKNSLSKCLFQKNCQSDYECNSEFLPLYCLYTYFFWFFLKPPFNNLPKVKLLLFRVISLSSIWQSTKLKSSILYDIVQKRQDAEKLTLSKKVTVLLPKGQDWEVFPLGV